MKISIIHIMAGLIAALCFLLALWGAAPSYLFAIVTLLMLAYEGYEVYCTAVAESGKHWMVDAAVLPSLVMFGIVYGASNFFYYTFPGEVEMDDIMINYQWLSCTTALAFLGLLSMWLGYRSQFGAMLADGLRRFLRFDTAFQSGWELNWTFVWLCVLASVASRLTEVSLGLYGYNSDLEAVLEAKSYTQFLASLDKLGNLALLALTLHCVGMKQTTTLTWRFLYAMVLCEVLFGLLAGFKSQVAFPAIIVALGYYTVKGKVPLLWMAAVPISMGLAFFLVGHMRNNRFNDPKYDNRSVIGILSSLIEALSEGESEKIEGDASPRTQYTLMRQNLTGFSAVAIRYTELVGPGDDCPATVKNHLLSPLYSMIPRVFWPEKPLELTGKWFAEEVMELGTTTHAVSIGPIGQLYLAGGVAGVCVGFLVFGIIQRIIYQAFWRRDSGGALLVYLAALGVTALFQGSIDSVVISLMRYVPLLIVCQYFMFKRL